MARHVGLIGEARRGGDRGEPVAGPDDLQPGGARPELAAKLARRHAERRGERARCGLARHAASLGPAREIRDEYAGTYQLTEAIHYTIRRDGDRLIGERTGRPAQELRVEARDVLFVRGQPRSRKVFQRDAGGQITGFADRREARDVVWTRLP